MLIRHWVTGAKKNMRQEVDGAHLSFEKDGAGREHFFFCNQEREREREPTDLVSAQVWFRLSYSRRDLTRGLIVDDCSRSLISCGGT